MYSRLLTAWVVAFLLAYAESSLIHSFSVFLDSCKGPTVRHIHTVFTGLVSFWLALRVPFCLRHEWTQTFYVLLKFPFDVHCRLSALATGALCHIRLFYLLPFAVGPPNEFRGFMRSWTLLVEAVSGLFQCLSRCCSLSLFGHVYPSVY